LSHDLISREVVEEFLLLPKLMNVRLDSSQILDPDSHPREQRSDSLVARPSYFEVQQSELAEAASGGKKDKDEDDEDDGMESLSMPFGGLGTRSRRRTGTSTLARFRMRKRKTRLDITLAILPDDLLMTLVCNTNSAHPQWQAIMADYVDNLSHLYITDNQRLEEISLYGCIQLESAAFLSCPALTSVYLTSCVNLRECAVHECDALTIFNAHSTAVPQQVLQAIARKCEEREKLKRNGRIGI